MSDLPQHLQKLHAFAVVAQLGSFRKAAARLRVSQPALSQSVRALEMAIGKPLLVRTAQGVVPTEEGVVLRGFAEKLTTDLEALDRELLAAGEPMSGHVRIGSFESFTVYLFPGFIAHASSRFPKLSISITSGQLDVLTEMLIHRRVHLTVVAEAQHHAQLYTEELFRDDYRFFAATTSSSSSSSSSSSTSKSMDRAPIIFVPEARDHAGRTVQEHVAPCMARRRPAILLSTFDAVKAFTMRGIGIGVLPSLVARVEVQAGKLEEIRVAGAKAGGFGEHRIVAQLHERERTDLRLERFLGELKRYAVMHREGVS